MEQSQGESPEQVGREPGVGHPFSPPSLCYLHLLPLHLLTVLHLQDHANDHGIILVNSPPSSLSLCSGGSFLTVISPPVSSCHCAVVAPFETIKTHLMVGAQLKIAFILTVNRPPVSSCHCAVVAPLETIRTHLMVGTTDQRSLVGVFNWILETEGWTGLFRGNGINVLRVAPSKAIEVSSAFVSGMLSGGTASLQRSLCGQYGRATAFTGSRTRSFMHHSLCVLFCHCLFHPCHSDSESSCHTVSQSITVDHCVSLYHCVTV